MIDIIVDAIVLAYEALDKLIEAASRAGVSGKNLDDMVAERRAARRKQVAEDQAEERRILPG